MSALEPRTSTDLAVPDAPNRGAVRPPVGLLLSIGDQAPNSRGGGTHPVKLDHFRAKEGALGQYRREVARFDEVYGEEPKVIEDMHFLSDIVPHVLDIRYLAFSQTGFRGRGLTNFASVDPAEFDRRAWSFVDDFQFFPKDATEVRPELRESWQGEPINGKIEGPDDPRVARLGIKLVCSLEFLLPEVMGVGKVCKISTSGRRSIRNLMSGVWDQWSFFGGRLRGVPFRLEVRPARTQRFDEKERKMVTVNFFELVLDTSYTVAEIQQFVEDRRRVLGEPSREERALQGRMMHEALALPSPGGEETLREEPVAGPSDALINRIAALQEEIVTAGGDWTTTLRGVFGVEDARELSADDAERYWTMLERALPAEEVEGEVLEDSAEEQPVEAEEAPQAGASVETVPPDETPVTHPAPAQEAAGAATPSSAPPPTSLADAIIPGHGKHAGKTLGSMDERWVRWALAHPRSLGSDSFMENVVVPYAAEKYGIEP